MEGEANYFEWLRGDVLAAVPASAQSILSIGCGGGVTEACLVRAGKKVVGVEMNPIAAANARSRGIEVIEDDVTSTIALLKDRKFDCIIYADVLEHLCDPESIMAEHISSLSPGGTVIVSIPNFRHWSVAWALLVRGEFRYKAAGIFDRTHLRITTRKAVEGWFRRFGLDIVRVRYGISGRRARLMSLLTANLLREFLATQVLIVGVAEVKG
jgi:methionine biosynthesis protein MetW